MGARATQALATAYPAGLRPQVSPPATASGHPGQLTRAQWAELPWGKLPDVLRSSKPAGGAFVWGSVGGASLSWPRSHSNAREWGGTQRSATATSRETCFSWPQPQWSKAPSWGLLSQSLAGCVSLQGARQGPHWSPEFINAWGWRGQHSHDFQLRTEMPGPAPGSLSPQWSAAHRALRGLRELALRCPLTVHLRSAASAGTHGAASPGPRRASAASWLGPGSAPCLPRRAWADPGGGVGCLCQPVA